MTKFKVGVNGLHGSLLLGVLSGMLPKRSSFIGMSRWRKSFGERFFSNEKEKNIVMSPMGDMKIPDLLFHEVIFNNWGLWERRTAIMCGRTGRKYTFRDLRNFSKALAANLQNKLNLGKGDMVAVTLLNCPEYPIIFLAASQIGITLTTINPNYTNFEMQNHLQETKPKVTITSASLYQKCHLVAEASKVPSPVLIVRTDKGDEVPAGTIDLFELFDLKTSGELKRVELSTDDTLILPFSSGTTGTPKGVLLTHKTLVANLTQLGHPETILLLSPTWIRQGCVLGILPMCHIFGMMVMTFFTIKEGSRIITLPSFNAPEFLTNLQRNRVSLLFAVPPIISFLSLDEVSAKHMKSLTYIINGAARYTIKDVEKLMQKCLHLKVAQGYGMTEASPVVTHTPTSRMQKLTTVGVPIAATRLKVVNLDTGEALPSGKTGELWVKGPQVMKGYYKKPKETSEIIIDGWLKTGDVAYYDEDGDFFLVDRLKELIKVSGLQVSPMEVEETLKILPKIKEVVVVGIPDEKFGEVPKAYIVTHKKDDLTAEEVNTFLAEKLSPHKQLRGGIEFVDDLPKSNTGKILRGNLRKKS